MLKVLLTLALAGCANAIQLTSSNFDEKTAGRTVFIKFLAPWCGHCKKMKPAWDALMAEFNTPEFNKNAIIADVDCTVEKDICSKYGVKGYPSIKHGDLASLQDYNGGRDETALKEFASKNLGPSCGPANLDLCSDEQKADIERIDAMSTEDINAAITKADDEGKAAEETFKAEVEKLQKRYEELSKEKEETVKALKSADLGVMKQIQASRASGEGGKEEL